MELFFFCCSLCKTSKFLYLIRILFYFPSIYFPSDITTENITKELSRHRQVTWIQLQTSQCGWLIINNIILHNIFNSLQSIISYITKRNIILKHILCTEIEGNFVKSNSYGIGPFWMSYIDNHVTFLFEIPDFGNSNTEKFSIIKDLS